MSWRSFLCGMASIHGTEPFSLYKEFGSKEGLFYEAFAKYCSDIGFLMQFLTQEPRGLGNVRKYVQELTKFPWYQGCFAVNALPHHPAMPVRNRKQVFKLFNDGEKLIYDNLQAAQKNGEIDQNMDIQTFASLIQAIDMGFLVYHILNPKQELRSNMVAIVNDLLLAGTAAK